MLHPKKLTQAKHAADEAPTPGLSPILRSRVFASIAAAVIAFTSAATAGAAITDTDDRSETERLAADIVAAAVESDYEWEEVAVLEAIIPVKVHGTTDVEKTEAAEIPEEEPEPVAEETPPEAPPGPSVDIAADCSGYSGNKAVGCTMTLDAGWGLGEFSCLESLWDRESGWNETAANPSSGAYGIPQSLPGDKMASHGGDWRTNPATQIAWGLDYIEGRYGSPCGAWSHSESNGWY